MEDQGEAQPKRFNLEVGPRDNPLIWALREDLFPRNSGRAYYIDKEYAPLKNLQGKSNANVDTWDEFRGEEPKPLPVQGDAAHIPLASDTTNLIMASNLFGADDHFEINVENGHIKGMLKLPEWKDIATEWHRVLAPEGKVIIIENLTPPRVSKLKDLFSQNGFILTEENKGYKTGRIFGDERTSLLLSDMDSYSLVFQKEATDIVMQTSENAESKAS